MIQYLTGPFVSKVKYENGLTDAKMGILKESDEFNGLYILGTSKTKNTNQVTLTITEHLSQVRGIIKKLSQKEYEALTSAASTKLRAMPRDFYAENELIWQQVLENPEITYDARQEQLVEVLRKVTREEFIAYFNALFFSTNSNSCRLDICQNIEEKVTQI